MRKTFTAISFLLFLQVSVFAQTTIVKDIRKTAIDGNAGSDPFYMMDINGTLFFTADDGVSGRELYKSNGTDASTALVKDINKNESGSFPDEFVKLNNQLVFIAESAEEGRELFKSDGTAAGTVCIKDIVAGPESSYPDNLTTMGSFVYFSIGEDLWKTNGTAEGTMVVKKLAGGISNIINANGTLYFVSDGGELWKSNGTTTGTYLVRRLIGSFANLTAFKGKVFFTYYNLNASSSSYLTTKLWVSDGSGRGTVQLNNIEISNPQFTALDQHLYFVGISSTKGKEIFRTDGTSAGTTVVTDINTGGDSFSSYSSDGLTAFNNNLYFVATNSSYERALYKTDGTGSGTQEIVAAPAFFEEEEVMMHGGKELFFSNGNSLYRTDGTDAGTQKIGTYAAPIYGRFTTIGNTLFLSAAANSYDYELWSYTSTNPVRKPTTPIAKAIEVPQGDLINSVNIYPNSFNTSTTVLVSEEKLANKNLLIKVLNNDGKILKTYPIKANEEAEIGSELPSGRFIVQIVDGTTVKNSMVIIKD